MHKFSLAPSPQFKAKVDIHVPGGEPAQVEFTFKHKPKKDLGVFVESREGVAEIDTVMECLAGWSLSDDFTRENVETLLDNYATAGTSVYTTYVQELVNARVKN
jgi:hypothetical protein